MWIWRGPSARLDAGEKKSAPWPSMRYDYNIINLSRGE
jgi:hypothetical protein